MEGPCGQPVISLPEVAISRPKGVMGIIMAAVAPEEELRLTTSSVVSIATKQMHAGEMEVLVVMWNPEDLESYTLMARHP